jgi:hypothetical protein
METMDEFQGPIFKIFSPNETGEKNRDFDSNYSYFGRKKDHKFAF